MSMNDFNSEQTGNTQLRLERLEKELGILRVQIDSLLTTFGKLRDETKKNASKAKKGRIINPPITTPRKRGRPRKVR